jgi:hypothetical protein
LLDLAQERYDRGKRIEREFNSSLKFWLFYICPNEIWF